MPTLHVKVVPGSSRDRVAGRYGEGVKVQVCAPPEDGRANKAVIAVLARALGVKPAQLAIVRGQAQPRKVVEITGVDQAKLAAFLAALE
jgi:uncharacterized protein (TIGR00251 family)